MASSAPVPLTSIHPAILPHNPPTPLPNPALATPGISSPSLPLRHPFQLSNATLTNNLNPHPPSPQETPVDLTYSLPNTVASLRDGLLWSSQSSAVVSGLLAASAAQLYSFFKDSNNFKGSPAWSQDFALCLCYISLVCNISATISSFFVNDALGNLAFTASKSTAISGMDVFYGTSNRILQSFGVTTFWSFLVWHWIIEFYFGIFTLTALILAYVWLQESTPIRVVITVVSSLTIFPNLLFVFIRMQSKRG